MISSRQRVECEMGRRKLYRTWQKDRSRPSKLADRNRKSQSQRCLSSVIGLAPFRIWISYLIDCRLSSITRNYCILFSFWWHGGWSGFSVLLSEISRQSSWRVGRIFRLEAEWIDMSSITLDCSWSLYLVRE